MVSTVAESVTEGSVHLRNMSRYRTVTVVTSSANNKQHCSETMSSHRVKAQDPLLKSLSYCHCNHRVCHCNSTISSLSLLNTHYEQQQNHSVCHSNALSRNLSGNCSHICKKTTTLKQNCLSENQSLSHRNHAVCHCEEKLLKPVCLSQQSRNLCWRIGIREHRCHSDHAVLQSSHIVHNTKIKLCHNSQGLCPRSTLLNMTFFLINCIGNLAGLAQYPRSPCHCNYQVCHCNHAVCLT